MSRGVVTIEPDAEVATAARMMVERKIGGLPVVDRDQGLVVIITATDILAAFIDLSASVAGGDGAPPRTASG
jgi:acetoin utilization protein AcuB